MSDDEETTLYPNKEDCLGCKFFVINEEANNYNVPFRCCSPLMSGKVLEECISRLEPREFATEYDGEVNEDMVTEEDIKALT